MNRRVLNFEHEGKTVLGFDTGLDAQSFAQAKMAAYITNPGFIVYPDGKSETWVPEGVAERETMYVWGAAFAGEELTGIITNPARKDEALNALRFWLRAGAVLEKISPDGEEPVFPGPAGAFIVSGKSKGQYPEGTIFFPPARLLKRTIEAEGSAEILAAERWVHPDLKGAESRAFSAGAALYQIFCGDVPFPGGDEDEVRQNIREAVFIPPNLAAPGLAPEMCETINRAMSSTERNKEKKIRPAPDFICGEITPTPAKNVSAWFKPLGGEELSKTRAALEQYRKKKTLSVKTRRFMIRNTTILTGALIGVIALFLIVRGYIRHQAELPTTQGMTPVQVAETYYNSFGTLDHTLMEACVIDKAGKGDIEMVINLFVISRVREAYETSGRTIMPAEEWIAAGRPEDIQSVFGVADLEIKNISEGEAAVSLEAAYSLWMPGSYLRNDEDISPVENEMVPLPPGSLVYRDKVNLVLHKGAWRIAEIIREGGPPAP